MKDYSKEKIVIIGMGVTGFSCLNFFVKRGIFPKIMDTRLHLRYLVKEIPKNISYQFGSLNKDWLYDSTLIIVSPGFSLSHPFILNARKNGSKIIGDIELFTREITVPILAITGSNGKSTVAKIIFEMAKNANIKAGLGGNIGIPVLTLLEFPYEIYILELSSFQLETIYDLKTIASTILNISADHIDRYPFGIFQYGKIKQKIYDNAEVCIFNKDDILTFPNFSKKKCISFGKKNSNYCLKKIGKYLWIVAFGKPLIKCIEMKIIGYHNYMNALAALALADTIGIPREYSLFTLRNFNGLPHRFELIHECNGIKWINDSKSTNIGSFKAAITNIVVSRNNYIHLLIGGDGKSADFSSISKFLNKDYIKPYFFGKDRFIISAFCSKKCSVITETMEEAISIIKKRLYVGDVVLLSPACSSLDQFKNFEERGEIFTRLAKI